MLLQDPGHGGINPKLLERTYNLPSFGQRDHRHVLQVVPHPNLMMGILGDKNQS